MKGTLIVRKYKNRRLYDTEQSTHITREELLAIVKNGRNVQVQEAKTGEDVTVETLLQVLLSETGGSLNSSIPAEFIHFMIRARRDNLFRFFRDYVPSAMQAFQSTVRNLRDQSKRITENLFPYPGYSNPWAYPFSQAPQAQSETSELDEMKARLKELEDKLGSGKGKKGK